MNITASHPAVIGHCRRSSRWRRQRAEDRLPERRPVLPRIPGSAGRAVVSFEYLGKEGLAASPRSITQRPKDGPAAGMKAFDPSFRRMAIALNKEHRRWPTRQTPQAGRSEEARYRGHYRRRLHSTHGRHVRGLQPDDDLQDARRDPDFAQQISRAGLRSEITSMERVRNASAEGGLLAAATWVLERRHSRDYAQRPPEA